MLLSETCLKVHISSSNKFLINFSSLKSISDSIDELFLKMRKQVNLESKFQREVLTVCGALDCIVNASSIMRDNDYENDAGAKSM